MLAIRTQMSKTVDPDETAITNSPDIMTMATQNQASTRSGLAATHLQPGKMIQAAGK
jgi:hypothetical protein